jgi:wyosine [tRNA(Phe)-imidazoG37] synthetase (radical SAM superfamily)
MARVYSGLKMFRFPDRLSAIAAGKIPAPVHVRIKPTNVCNHDCWYCAYRNDQLDLGETMVERDYLPEEKMREIVSDLGEMGVKAVTLSGGGEPLIYPHIEALIHEITSRGIRLGVLTNGSRLKGRLAQQLRRHATWVRISIDAADDASYAKNRRIKPGSFHEVLGNMRDFVSETGKAILGVSFIIDHHNHDRIAEACAQFKEAGISQVKLSPVMVHTDTLRQNAYHDAIREKVELEIRKVQDSLVDEKFQISNDYKRQNQSFQKSYTRCSWSKLMTVIGADQKVYLCQDKAYIDSACLGSLAGRTFRDLWASEDLAERLRAVNPSVHCTHHCVAHQKNLALEEYLDCDSEHADFI